MHHKSKIIKARRNARSDPPPPGSARGRGVLGSFWPELVSGDDLKKSALKPLLEGSPGPPAFRQTG